MTLESPRRFDTPHHAHPRTHLLCTGRYSVMVTAAGSGYSRWRDLAVTRWREDPTCDPWGSYIFLRDAASGEIWSAGYQPVGREPESFEAGFFEDRAEFSRKDGSILTSMTIVAAGDEAEVRSISLTNQGSGAREIELTSYAEVVLSQAAADSAHPAFSKMFVQTDYAEELGALLATRRPREPSQPQVWMAHFCVVEGSVIGALQFETDRARFLGRGRDVRHAAAISRLEPLSGTVGTVLDPVMALRRLVRIQPGETARVAFWTVIAASREDALDGVRKLQGPAAFEAAKTQAKAASVRQLQDLGMSFEEAQVFQDIAARLLYADSSLRAPTEVLENNRLGQSALWPHGISGDLPIVLFSIDDAANLTVLGELLHAHAFWQLKNFGVDLIILNEDSSPGSTLQAALEAAIKQRRGAAAPVLLRADALPPGHRDLLQSAARAIFTAGGGPLSSQAARAQEPTPEPRLDPKSNQPRAASARGSQVQATAPLPALEFFNGLGGFDAAAREYVIVMREDEWTPAPWINIVSNPQFGFLASADGCGSTWWRNAQQNQITPWSNDAVSDTPSEAIYIRDEESGDLWSATPLPIRLSGTDYTVRHGFGSTRCAQTSNGISLELLQFVPLEDAVKISRLKLVNRSGSPRRLSITYYLDWVLGNQNNRAAPFVVTEVEPASRAILARNPWSTDFQPQVAFMDMAGRQQSHTGDRAEFLGRHGSLSEPRALLAGRPLSSRVGAGLDPCGAMQTVVHLEPGQSSELTLLLGAAISSASAAALVEHYRSLDLEAVYQDVTRFWDDTLKVIQVKTPDRSMDTLVNGWLLYQTLSSRVWGRTGFYQSSGAYGFRDQLQDVMALCVCAPAIAREHILRAAARQFTEGDVQHWWLPTTGAGVKTRVSDDRIWLAFVVSHYLETTADFPVLDEQVPFLTGGPLQPGTLENFSSPASADPASLYEHCARALDSSLSVGAHALPLFGTGDWNDGMNRVGIEGRGESVWLAWFLNAALLRFASVADRRGEAAAAARWRGHAAGLGDAIEHNAWDGDWYRRGYYDDGTPLGSASSDECRIDSIAQSWAVISGAGEAARSSRAMSSVDSLLVDRSTGIVKLFTPAFDHTAHDPGYIKAYPPGLRENGGQYTHAATWTVLAFALLGDGDKAVELHSMLNPISHSSSSAAIERYKVEPYVVCADLYSAPGHLGRGGWTWYTGSAGWMYRSAVEGILGIILHGQVLKVDPCIPRAWRGFEFTYRHGSSSYRIAVKNPRQVSRGIANASLDGRTLAGPACEILLIDDGQNHLAEVTLG